MGGYCDNITVHNIRSIFLSGKSKKVYR